MTFWTHLWHFFKSNADLHLMWHEWLVRYIKILVYCSLSPFLPNGFDKHLRSISFIPHLICASISSNDAFYVQDLFIAFQEILFWMFTFTHAHAKKVRQRAQFVLSFLMISKIPSSTQKGKSSENTKLNWEERIAGDVNYTCFFFSTSCDSFPACFAWWKPAATWQYLASTASHTVVVEVFK